MPSGSEEYKGIIFDIQRYAIHDGPGIRTLIFLKGCPLRCKWCQNPESWKKSPEIIFFEGKCIACKRCETACEWNAIHFEDPGRINREQCKVPDCSLNCIKECVANALQIVGTEKTVSQVIESAKKDVNYYKNSGGGITVSGGEPFFQPKFLAALLKQFKKENFHVVIETCGNVSWDLLESLLPSIDILYYDIKLLDRAKHREQTGVTNALILANITKLVQIGFKNLIIRTPIIPSINDDSEFITALAQFMKNLGLKEVHLLPYHRLAEKKYERLGLEYPLKNLPPLEQKTLLEFKKILESESITVKIGGT